MKFDLNIEYTTEYSNGEFNYEELEIESVKTKIKTFMNIKLNSIDIEDIKTINITLDKCSDDDFDEECPY